ncbi:F-box only protein 9-like [Asterias amurensis]|uniref:F-box only protein 9-like n=1 Tax=Asterias amurensis TaxID=7602 RepID=UPI003AB64007
MAQEEHFICRETFQEDHEEDEIDLPDDETNLEKQLSSFRQQWKEELAGSLDTVTNGQPKKNEEENKGVDQVASGQPRLNEKQGQRKTTGQSLGTSGHQVEKELKIVGGQEEQTSTDNRSAKLTASSYQRSEKVTADDGSQQVCSDAQGSITDKVASLQASGSSNLSLQTPESPVNDESPSTKTRRESEMSVADIEKEDDDSDRENIEAKAKALFIQGVHAERKGKLTEAICKYRHAIQLMPDVESKITDYTINRAMQDEDDDIQDGYQDDDSDNDTQDDGIEDLVSELKSLTTNDIKSHCDPKFPQSSTHISSLPIELLLYIFRWVVSSDLDLRSLEVLSSVCRGFYVCARDPSLWHRACLSLWGRNCCKTKDYSSWRQMYLERPHPNFNGVYITKNTYFRQGETDLDGLYRPWHMVEYYRYVRMFPDGVIMMYSAPDEPKLVVSKIKNKNSSLPGILIGQYGIVDDMVTAILRRENTMDYESGFNRYIRFKRNKNVKNDISYTFHLEFSVRSAGHHPNCKLEWKSYRCQTHHRPTGNTSVADFEVDGYKPLIFSRVKSYTVNTDKPM